MKKDIKTAVMDLLKEYGLVSDSPKEEMVSYEVVYEPDTEDAHGQWMSHDTILDACDSFNAGLKKGIVKSNLFHLKDTELFTVEDTWIQKEFDVVVAGTEQPIKAGTWVAKIQYNDENLWELRKSGVIGGVSIGAKGQVNPETGEITNVSFEWGES